MAPPKPLQNRDATRLQPSGARAANVQGLTEQAPEDAVFPTGGVLGEHRPNDFQQSRQRWRAPCLVSVSDYAFSRYPILYLAWCLAIAFPVIAKAGESLELLQRQLFDAASSNDAKAVLVSIGKGIDIEARDAAGRSALLLATHHNAIEVARVLIDAGADVNAMDHIDDSPYLFAGAEGRLEILSMTLDHGADLGSVNRYGGTALIPAAHHGHVETVRVLLKTKTDIDHVNYLGWTALLEAIILGDGGSRYIEIVQLLVDAGADVNIPDGDGVFPLTHSLERGYLEISGILRDAGAKARE